MLILPLPLLSSTLFVLSRKLKYTTRYSLKEIKSRFHPQTDVNPLRDPKIFSSSPFNHTPKLGWRGRHYVRQSYQSKLVTPVLRGTLWAYSQSLRKTFLLTPSTEKWSLSLDSQPHYDVPGFGRGMRFSFFQCRVCVSSCKTLQEHPLATNTCGVLYLFLHVTPGVMTRSRLWQIRSVEDTSGVTMLW